jgi:hypothetical protein
MCDRLDNSYLAVHLATAGPLLALEMPINDFDVLAVHGGLAAASDSEVL